MRKLHWPKKHRDCFTGQAIFSIMRYKIVGGNFLMAKVIHTMIRVLEEQRSLDFYATALGMKIADRFAFDSFTLVYLRNAENDFEIELTLNHDRTAPYNHADGYGHIAIAVDDLADHHARVTAAGIAASPIKELFHDQTLLARFFFMTDPDGYKIEVLQRHGRYR